MSNNNGPMQMGRYARIWGWIFLASLLTACASSKSEIDKLRNAARFQHGSAWEAYKVGDNATAIASWKIAANALRPGSEPYFDGELYADHATYLANAAWAELKAGDVKGASQDFTDVLVTLQRAEEQHRDLLRQRDKTRNNIGLGLNIATTVLATVVSAKANTPQQNLQAQQYLHYVMANQLPTDVDSTGQVKAFIGDTPLDKDAVRFPVLPTLHPHNTIAQFLPLGCTASLVGHRLALTNAHCVSDKDGRQLNPSKPFELVFRGIRDETRVPVERIVYDEKYRRDTERSDSDYSDDWALLVLARHPERRGYLGLAPSNAVDTLVNARGLISVAGHSADLNDGRFITMDWGCRLKSSRRKAVLRYDCATFGGSSGSPILAVEGPYKHTRVIGVHACGQETSKDASRKQGRVGRDECGSHVRNFKNKLEQLRAEIGNSK